MDQLGNLALRGFITFSKPAILVAVEEVDAHAYYQPDEEALPVSGAGL